MLSAVLFLQLLWLVFAQTPIATRSDDPAGTPVMTYSGVIPLTGTSYPSTFTTCVLSTGTTTQGFDPTASPPRGAVCYEIIMTTGAIVEDAKYTVGVNDGSSSDAPAIAGAVIGSVLAVTLLVLAVIYWRKRAVRRRQKMTSRASRVWTNRSGGWVDDRRTNDNIVLQNWSNDAHNEERVA